MARTARTTTAAPRPTWTPVTIPCTYGGKPGTWRQNSPGNRLLPDPNYGTFIHAKDPGFGPMDYPNIARSQIVPVSA